MTKPPPTPKSPDRNPAIPPENISALAQGILQASLPINVSNKHGGGLLAPSVIPKISLPASLYRLIDE